jgi:recombination protein RecA
MKIGVMFGSPETTTTGGNALKFYASVRALDIRRITNQRARKSSATKRGEGGENKVASPFKTAESTSWEGISRLGEVLTWVRQATSWKAGAWYAKAKDRPGARQLT